MADHQRRNVEGFTLIELLVVLVLTATMVVGVIGQLRPMKAIQERARLQRVADRIADVMAEDIRNALPLPLLSPEANGRSMIVMKDRIEFVAVVRTGFRTRGLRQMHYLVERREGETEVLMRQVLLRSASQSEGVWKAAVEQRLARVVGLEIGIPQRENSRIDAPQADLQSTKRTTTVVRVRVAVGEPGNLGESVRVVLAF